MSEASEASEDRLVVVDRVLRLEVVRESVEVLQGLARALEPV